MQNHVVSHSGFFISQVLNSSIEQIVNSLSLSSSVIIVSTPFFPVFAFHTPGIPLDPEDISSICPN